MALTGFDPKFTDFPDYIIGITKEIWEDRGIATLHQYYAPDIVVRSPASVVVGNQGVIAATMATLAEFPDRQLLGEDVIWSGTPEAGMLSSHRIISTATHARDGVYGAASGKKLRYRILADCHARDNAIDDEWLFRDQTAIVRQIGWDPIDYARDLIAREGGPDACVRPLTPANDRPGPYTGRGNENACGQRHADLLTRIMGASKAAIETDYDRAATLHYPGRDAALSGRRHWARLGRSRRILDGPARGLSGRGIPHRPPDRTGRSEHAAPLCHPLVAARHAQRLGRIWPPDRGQGLSLGHQPRRMGRIDRRTGETAPGMDAV
jgi:hypothetical protein